MSINYLILYYIFRINKYFKLEVMIMINNRLTGQTKQRSNSFDIKGDERLKPKSMFMSQEILPAITSQISHIIQDLSSNFMAQKHSINDILITIKATLELDGLKKSNINTATNKIIGDLRFTKFINDIKDLKLTAKMTDQDLSTIINQNITDKITNMLNTYLKVATQTLGHINLCSENAVDLIKNWLTNSSDSKIKAKDQIRQAMGLNLLDIKFDQLITEFLNTYKENLGATRERISSILKKNNREKTINIEDNNLNELRESNVRGSLLSQQNSSFNIDQFKNQSNRIKPNQSSILPNDSMRQSLLEEYKRFSVMNNEEL